MIVESLSIYFTNFIFMKNEKDKTVSLWPFVWILLVAVTSAVGSMVLALFITN